MKTLQQVFEEQGSKFPFMAYIGDITFGPYIIHARSTVGYFIGEDKDGDVDLIESSEQATIHTPPKQKVKLYHYACLSYGRWSSADYYYKDDEDFISKNLTVKKFLRLDNTMIEVDDE